MQPKASWHGLEIRTLVQLVTLVVIAFMKPRMLYIGKGGAILVNAPELMQQAEIIREKGTDGVAGSFVVRWTNILGSRLGRHTCLAS